MNLLDHYISDSMRKMALLDLILGNEPCRVKEVFTKGFLSEILILLSFSQILPDLLSIPSIFSDFQNLYFQLSHLYILYLIFKWSVENREISNHKIIWFRIDKENIDHSKIKLVILRFY